MTLLEIHDESVYADVKSVIVKSGRLAPTYWIGLRDVANENDFIWATSGQPMSFADFKNNEPNNGGTESSDEDCVEISPKYIEQNNEQMFEWNDVPCDAQTGFICHAISVE